MTTEAALKAWKTRRRNGWVHPAARVEEPKRRTKAAAKAVKASRKLTPAQKAAATRAAKALAAKRTAAARKAWATRRANG